MKKLFGITFGGLQRRTLELTIALIVITAVAFTIVSMYQNRSLVGIVDQTRTEQQQAITDISEDMMLQIQESTLTNTVSMQASIAEADFSEVVNDARILKTMAETVLKKKGYHSPTPVSPPNASMDGVSSAFVLCDEGVDYTGSKNLMRVADLAPAMIAMHANSSKIDSCYIGLEDGTFFCVDEKASQKLDENGEPLSFDARSRPWYRGAIRTGTLYFTGIIRDAFSGKPLISCSVPIEVNGGVVGVIGIDILLDGVDSFIQSAVTTPGSAVFIANKDGQIILSSDQNGVFATNSAERLMDESGSALVTSLASVALVDTTDLNLITVGGREYYMAGAPVPTIGWAVIIAVDKELTEVPEKELLASYDEISGTAKALFNEKTGRLRRFEYILFIAIIVLGIAASYLAARRVAKPIEEITRDVVKCAENNTFFEMKDHYRSNDEIELLALSFDNVSKRMKRYIEDITAITAEKERIGTELALATQIQSAMLPHRVPAFPDRHEFDIIGSMDPAKEVGGDFFDYFLIDDDHLGLLIADVSGKGVPAALFMMASKIILQSVAMLGGSPAEILTKTNTAICSSNEAEMFVTVWVGILELSTGKLTAANAGHEYPAIMRAGGGFELFKDRHGFVLGGMAGMRYKEYELQLEPGDKLFVYTDGVTEATSEEKELFGTDRMLQALNRDPGQAPEGILDAVRGAVDEFVRDAEQFDDLTMLCLEYKGPKGAAEA